MKRANRVASRKRDRVSWLLELEPTDRAELSEGAEQRAIGKVVGAIAEESTSNGDVQSAWRECSHVR